MIRQKTDGQAQQADLAVAVGGWSLILASVAFMAVFAYLAAAFNYPDVLDGRAADVLPSLLSLGPEGRAVWGVYGLLPLLLIPAAVGTHAALRSAAPGAARAAFALATVSGVAMLLGLLRWPSVHWSLATAYAGAASDTERAAISAMFDGLNSYLGVFVGEFVGELTLNLYFLLTALASWRSSRMPTWSVWAGSLAALSGLVGMWRNVTPAVAWVAEIENYVLPLWMIVLGVLLVRAAKTKEAMPNVR